ncbi:hypothetical protein QOZ80_4AG0319190 [Eleusine coracana subsp. coracana]|nr:hypothetical protein QOZ80_4AG0319190 [Eleusine coracana subsp. coracana]
MVMPPATPRTDGASGSQPPPELPAGSLGRNGDGRGRQPHRGGGNRNLERSVSRPVVVHKTVRKFSGSTTYPMLMRMNYTDWALMMKVMLQARGVWVAIDSGTDNKLEDRLALEAILHAVPSELISTLATKETAKLVWDKLKSLWIGSDRARKGKAQ